MRQEIKTLLSRTPKIVFAATAISFALLLLVFVCVLFMKGIDDADKVWSWPWPTIVWILALPISAKYLVRGR